MSKHTIALLVHDYEYPLRDLWSALCRLDMDIRRARTCAEAKVALASSAPDLVFTDTELPDGDWTATLALAGRTRPPVPVIVVSRVVDIALYLDAIEAGAQEFIVPPFRDADIRYVVQGARARAPAAAILSCSTAPAPRTAEDPGIRTGREFRSSRGLRHPM